MTSLKVPLTSDLASDSTDAAEWGDWLHDLTLSPRPFIGGGLLVIAGELIVRLSRPARH